MHFGGRISVVFENVINFFFQTFLQYVVLWADPGSKFFQKETFFFHIYFIGLKLSQQGFMDAQVVLCFYFENLILPMLYI